MSVLNVIKTGITDKEAICLQLADEGYTVYEWYDPPGARYPNHAHPMEEARWIVSGSITLGVKGEHLKLFPGDRVVLPSQLLHNAETDEGVSYICGSR